jgi:hypothetical protein
MSTFASKVVAYGVIGSGDGIAVSKLVAYVVLQPGTEEGATPPVRHSHSYAHILNKPNPVGAG